MSDTPETAAVDGSGRPDEYTVEVAAHAVRVHCVMFTPVGRQCLNCHRPHPCVTHLWGRDVLVAAGWGELAIASLDRRTGPWS